MYYVYQLKSEKCEKTYIGYTTNVKERLDEHNQGKSGFTRKHGPWKLIYYEAYLSEKDARRREKELKEKGSKRETLKKQIKFSLKE